MKKIFKKEYIRKTTDNKWLLVYILTAFMAGLLTAGVFIKSYSYFTSINKPQALLSPLDGLESLVVGKVYANEIKKEDTNWWRIYQRVRWLESNGGTKGLAVTCRRKRMVNSIGYMGEKGFCFSSQAEEELTFARWMTKHITFEGMTEDQALRLYSGNAYGI